ncbi:MAG: potassium channel family protein [Planctomycetes bacterium]|nr:potassium channel family protein [Planctomycetota bacterium]
MGKFIENTPYMVELSNFRSLVGLLITSILILGMGSGGYMLLEGFSFVDAFYMTLITVTTVGFGEVRALSPAGKVFTCFLIFFGIGYIAICAQALSAALVEKIMTQPTDLAQKRIDAIRDHYIICGFGRVGYSAAEHLTSQGAECVIVDRSPEGFEEDYPELNTKDTNIIFGDATDEDTLLKAGIARASGLMCVLPSDPDNLFIILTARDLNPNLHIVTRTTNKKNHERRLIKAGADEVISPYRIAGIEIASYLLRATTDLPN